MDLIVTHINADFDALGAAVAVRKLYPGARLLLPGSQEEAVREFLALTRELIPFESERTCRFDDVNRIILVDTRQRSRIGSAAQLIDRGIETHVYDHHPDSADDVRADKVVCRQAGATVTVLAGIIRAKRIKISPLEATAMLLGIYEETGSLTFRSTTKGDVDAVSFLLAHGAALSVVSRYLNRELTEGELGLLTKLIHMTQRVVIKGMTVSFIKLESDDYVGELGMLIHKLVEIENIPVLFVLVREVSGKVTIIARSAVNVLDVNAVLSEFGGGGHETAASAKVHSDNLDLICRRILRAAGKHIRTSVCARDLMVPCAELLPYSMTAARAHKILMRNAHDAAPVIDRGRIVGIVTIDAIARAVKQGFGHAPIKGCVDENIAAVGRDVQLRDLERIARGKAGGIILVIYREKVVGVIRRTDLLKSIHAELFTPEIFERDVMVKDLSGRMRELLPAPVMRLVKAIGRMGRGEGYPTFVAGGFVRDILIGRRTFDLDIVVEGDAIRFGHIVCKKYNASIVVHKKFGTCTVILPDKRKVDIAMARRETYEQPAALPVVEFSSLKEDLIRRDFTINAMAVSIDPESFGQLIDFFGGQRDLICKCIKVLHDKSFIDDPTRIFRAVRFEQRLGFVIEEGTEKLIEEAVREDMFGRVEPQRIRDEIILILSEDDPAKALRRMEQLHELRFLDPRIHFGKRTELLCGEIRKAESWYDSASFKKRALDKWLMYLMALVSGLPCPAVLRLSDRFVLRKGDAARLVSYCRVRQGVGHMLAGSAAVNPSRIYRVLEPLAYEVILPILAESAVSGGRVYARALSRVDYFFSNCNGVRISVGGHDLEAMGYRPSPGFKKVLTHVLYAKLDGIVNGRDEELAYAAKIARRIFK